MEDTTVTTLPDSDGKVAANLQTPEQRAQNIIRYALNKARSLKQQTAIALSGGKDSLVLLHLVAAIAQELGVKPIVFYSAHHLKENDASEARRAFFNCVDEHVTETMEIMYATLTYSVVYGQNLQQSVVDFMAANPTVKTVFLGVRGSDPDGRKLDGRSVAPSTEGWPEMERVFPLLSWTYGDVWNYIDRENVKYPVHYDRGFTSLNPNSWTDKQAPEPNPRLKLENGSFAHARTLNNYSLERM